MRLKKLYVQGYKTFANRTEFLFDEGITAIVGPNGSGKSNIADAIRWVLGEQSFRELRGRRSTDMIFSGSQQRARSSMAHVTLLLDNSDGELPIDYAEVEIGRRVYNDGANEYYLNGNRVRLKDITGLLATSGLAGRTYTMIGQGLVDQALSLKADERRALFEEAAGISHYKSRRAETLRRLRETQHNLERVHDILEEIRPRLRSLKRQATMAQNYEQIQTDLRELLRTWYGYQWGVRKERLRLSKVAAASAETAWKQSRATLTTEQDRVETLRARLNTFQQQLLEKETARDALREDVERLRRQVAILGERKTLNQRQLTELESEIPDLETQRAAAAADLQQATVDLQTAQRTLQAEEAALHTFEAGFKAQQLTIERWRKTVTDLDREQRDKRRNIAQVEGQLTQLRERLAERETESGDDDDVDLTGLQANATRLATEIETLSDQRDTQRRQSADLRRQRQEMIRDLKQRRRDAADQRRRVERLSKDVARLETRRDMLDQLRSSAVPSTGDARISGRLAERLTIPANLTTAIEAALADRLGALLVPDAEQLWQLIAHNPEQALVAVALDGADSARRPSAALPERDGVLGWAADLVSADTLPPALLDTFLGHVLVVTHAELAYELARDLDVASAVVSTDGVLVHSGGIVVTGAAQRATAIVEQEEAWRAAVEQVAAQQRELDQVSAALATFNDTIDQQQAKVDDLTGQIARADREEQMAARTIGKQQRTLDRLQQQATFLERQRASRQGEIERLRSRISKSETTLAQLNTSVVTVESNLNHARLELEALPVAEAEQQRASHQQTIGATRTIVAGRQAVVDSRRATLNQIESRLQRQQARHADLLKQQAQIELDNSADALRELQTKMERLDGAIGPLRQQRQQLLRMVSDLEADMGIHQRQAHKLETAYTEARVALAQAETQLENLVDRIHTDFGVVALSYDEDETVQTPLPMDEVVELLPQVDTLPAGLEDSIRKRRGQLQRMGTINPDAPQEYMQTEERIAFMEKQIEDLLDTEAQLREVIEELDELTSREFVATVKQVNEVFGGYFTQLFGGGSAELVLTDPDDLTVSGVDIIARLPRRREQGLAVLSGGERSLTAAALVFSLLKVAPPPFCVMDEVDAALDEANVTRFRDVLVDLSTATQFIVITHNRGTVQAANTLYGVSMASDSTSHLISIRTEDYVQELESA